MPAFDGNTLIAHRQLAQWSCIPSAVELVLKFEKRVALDYYDQQNAWQNKKTGNFDDYSGKDVEGLMFFKDKKFEGRHPAFPFADLFARIDSELAAGRFVIISLYNGGTGFHIWVITHNLPNGEYFAVTRGRDQAGNDVPWQCVNVRQQVQAIQGTDILTYAASPAAPRR